MANELLNALENRVNSAVDTIEGLRTELKELKAERLTLEDKMRDLLEKMGVDIYLLVKKIMDSLYIISSISL